ncbi:hypothetical protein RIF29_13889 [Crotalaria pallida]|uniref:Uncharacterized protein n=1 Tax=Crotalaria pallida TaxID=3830 RepID=A0AAN9FAS3_CROPI
MQDYLVFEALSDCKAGPNLPDATKLALLIKLKTATGFDGANLKLSQDRRYSIEFGYSWLRGSHRRFPFAKLACCNWAIPKHSFIAWIVFKLGNGDDDGERETGERHSERNVVVMQMRLSIVLLD